MPSKLRSLCELLSQYLKLHIRNGSKNATSRQRLEQGLPNRTLDSVQKWKMRLRLHIYALFQGLHKEFFVPCSSRSPTFFHSSIPGVIDFITPRILDVLAKIPRGPRKLSILLSIQNSSFIVVSRCNQLHYQSLGRYDSVMEGIIRNTSFEDFVAKIATDQILVILCYRCTYGIIHNISFEDFT